MNYPCSICKEEFDRSKLQESHDIPKYIGGTDKDGRHLLCKDCHKEYDKKLLKEFLKFIHYEFDLESDWIEIIGLQKSISGLKNLHFRFREISFKIKEEVFGDDSI